MFQRLFFHSKKEIPACPLCPASCQLWYSSNCFCTAIPQRRKNFSAVSANSPHFNPGFVAFLKYPIVNFPDRKYQIGEKAKQISNFLKLKNQATLGFLTANSLQLVFR